MMTSSHIESVLGPDGIEKTNEAFQAFKIDDTQLLNGRNGARIIEVVPDKKTLAEKMQSGLQEKKDLEGKGMEKFFMTPEYIRNWEYDVEPIPDSTIKETPEVERAQEEQFQISVSQLYPDLVNRDAMFEEYLRVWRKDITKLKLQTPLNRPLQPEQGREEGSINKQITEQATGGGQRAGTAKPSLNTLQGK